MSTMTVPGVLVAAVQVPPVADVASRRTVLGFVATRRVVEIILTVVLGVGSGLLFYGSSFGLNMVHTQLAAQNISFPPKGSPGLSAKDFPDLQRYAGQKVDSGPKAKAYANDFMLLTAVCVLAIPFVFAIGSTMSLRGKKVTVEVVE